MKGDFSRVTFNPRGHYTQLPLQQGRVLVDADWNEQAEIALYDRRVTGRAIIGASGGPLERAALRLQIVDNEPWLAIGGLHGERIDPDDPADAEPAWYWVEGRTLTQERAYRLDAQPHLSEPLPTAAGYYLAWVDVFEHLLTALDLPEIREVAMGGPDHGTRVQQIWQVKLQPFRFSSPQPPHCYEVTDSWRPETPSGRMHAKAADPVATPNPCVVPAAAGYRRLENQLYRVEIRAGGSEADATFVWSRDNGIVRVRAIEGSYQEHGQEPPSIELTDTGRDELTRLATGDWVEITDQERILAGDSSYLCQLAGVSGTTLTLSSATALSKTQFEALRGPTVRRWDTVDASKHDAAAAYLDGAEYPVGQATDHYFDLEDGVQVRFHPGTYRAGDYWLIPARTTSGKVEFPDTAQPPRGVQHHAATLAILHLDGEGTWRLVRDCRNLFRPLTRLTHLHYVGGDGQEAMPGQMLAGALEVAVSDGATPVEGVGIVFRVAVPSGTADTQAERTARGYLLDRRATDPNPANGRFSLTVPTDADGIASVRWVLGSADSPSSAGFSQHVTARLAKPGVGDPTGELHFHATQSIARQLHVDVTACTVNEEDPTLTSVQALLGAAGLDPSNPAHQNAQHVLHQLLCRLNARHVPYAFPKFPVAIEPASVEQVKGALDALYWLVLQGDGACCLAEVIQKLAGALGGASAEQLCDALKRSPVDGDCSLLEITLGAALHLVRAVYAVVLAFLDLQDAPGAERGYEGLKLGDEKGIELAAFIHGEGPGWFVTRVEERGEQAHALGDHVLDLVLSVLEQVFNERGLAEALQTLAHDYGAAGPAWNGPATRLFLLEKVWEPLFKTRRLDDESLIILRELLLEIVRRLWKALVQLLLCGEPLPEHVPRPKWLGKIKDDLGRALTRAFSLHGLVRELPDASWGAPQEAKMEAVSEAYPSGATWVVTHTSSAVGLRPHLLRWRNEYEHDTEQEPSGPLPALNALEANRLLPEPDLVISVKRDLSLSIRVRDLAPRRRSLNVLYNLAGPGGLDENLLWSIPSKQLSRLEGEYEETLSAGKPKFGKVYTDPRLRRGSTILVSGGPDDPPTLVSWPPSVSDLQGELYVWPPTVQPTAYVVDRGALLAVGLPPEPPSSKHAFSLDALDDDGSAVSGRFVAVALSRDDTTSDGERRRREVLLLLGGVEAEGRDENATIPWWQADELVPVIARDLPAGVSVVGGGHDLVALRDLGTPADGGTDEPSPDRQRWTLVSVDELLKDSFGTTELSWDTFTSLAIKEIPAQRWREGEIDSVVHGNDGPWLQIHGPLSGRLGLYRAWSGEHSGLPPLQRQMVLGAIDRKARAQIANAKALLTGARKEATEVLGRVAAVVRIDHDYLLQPFEVPTPRSQHPRLLTVCLRSGEGTPRIEFNASPRS